jgi:hypothetical protein
MDDKEVRHPTDLLLIFKLREVKEGLVVHSSVLTKPNRARLLCGLRYLTDRSDRVREPNLQIPSGRLDEVLPAVIERELSRMMRGQYRFGN